MIPSPSPRFSLPAPFIPLRPDSLTVTVLLVLLVACGPISTDLYLPTLPALMAAFSSSESQVELTLSIFLAGFAVSQLVCGPLSDRFGRRPVLLGGLIIYVAASVACALAESMTGLIVARLFQALGGCCGPVLGRAVVRDVYSREQAARMFSLMAMAMALAPMVGPVLGGLLTLWYGWPAAFAVLAGFGTVLLVAVAVALAETNPHCDPHALQPARLKANFGRLLQDRSYLGYVLCLSGVFSGMFAFISGSSFVMINHGGLSPPAYGLCFGLVVMGYILGSGLSRHFTVRLGADGMIRRGLWVVNLAAVLGVGLAMTGSSGAAGVVVPMALFMLGGGLVLPNAMAGAVGPFPAIAGTASALLGFAQMTTAAITGALLALTEAENARPMMLALWFSAFWATLAYGLTRRRLSRPRPPASPSRE